MVDMNTMIDENTSDVPSGPSSARNEWQPSRSNGGRKAVKRTLGARAKDVALGKALHNDDLAHERLGRPTALAVFSSDALSSTAYATEEILKTLLLAGLGVAAFGYAIPITVALVAVLAILMFSYRQTIKAYPSAGGAYIVTKDNLGLLPAQVAGVALLTDYVLTVAVSVSAGVGALYTAVPATYSWRVPIAVLFIILVAWGNLRGVKESGKIFAAPTYGFVIMVLMLIVVGVFKAATGTLHTLPADLAQSRQLKNAGLFLLLHAFASGGAAMTGVEAISNGVPAFKPVEWKNARSTLMVMGTLLATMFVGLSWLASRMHPFPNDKSTVIGAIGKGIFGNGVLFFLLQAMTLLILVLAANTSFADFPRLASFHAEDEFMPRQLTKRGHRLGFSNGILFLSVSAAALVIGFQASVDHLIPLYAIGVFTSFTLSQAGMSKHHVTHKEKGWKVGLVINAVGALATGVVTIIIGIFKFSHGAWAIILIVPIMVAVLVRLNHQYSSEADELSSDVVEALSSPVAATTISLVMLDHIDNAAAKALSVARSLYGDRTEAIHVAIDERRAYNLQQRWDSLRPRHITLRLIDCPDRKLESRAQSYVADLIADGRTQVNVLIPQLTHKRRWHTLLHDSTSQSLAAALAKLPHVNVTFVPFHLGGDAELIEAAPPVEPKIPASKKSDLVGKVPPARTLTTPIADLVWRRPATVAGRAEVVSIETSANTSSLIVTLTDGTGAVDLQFLGRPKVAGLQLGSKVQATGTVITHRGRMTMVNPVWELTAPNPVHQH
jgi:amino acid transporter